MKLDIGFRELAVGLANCAVSWNRSPDYQAVEKTWRDQGDGFAHLSVRSGFDLVLQLLKWPRGSEVLVSAVTIPHMIDILKAHGLVPVPVDIEPETMNVDVQAMESLVSDRTKAIMVAHLFGGRIHLDEVVELAGRKNLMLIEDCAQAFGGLSYQGDDRATISMFSFGTLKTATALGGALFTVRDQDLLNRLRSSRTTLPAYTNLYFAKKLARTACILSVVNESVYPVILRMITQLGHDHDAFINGSVRGFSGDGFFEKIRKQPPPALIGLLNWRLKHIREDHCDERASMGTLIHHFLPDSIKLLGSRSGHHTHWLTPIICDDPTALIKDLFQQGFDATRGCSSLIPVPAPEGFPEPKRAFLAFERLVYLPVFPPAGLRGAERLAAVLRQHANRQTKQPPPARTKRTVPRYGKRLTNPK
jgi:dTDP-4-amino-4,6-dideoxygalactose transaminase